MFLETMTYHMRWPRQWYCLRSLAVLLLLSSLLGGCALPSLQGRTVSHALDLPEARQTKLGQGMQGDIVAHPDKTGILPLEDALSAFAVRVMLVRAAERTLDLQYYIWQDDITGNLLLKEVVAAANRGVRIRLLLDDNGTSGMDMILSALNRHPNIEVRLFNPFVMRFPKAIGFVTDFSRLNYRMHNKSFIADNQVAIVGGRNIGDAYFAATEDVHFADMDLLSVGKVVNTVSQDFDRYWNSDFAYPAETILPPVADVALARFREMQRYEEDNPKARRYLSALRRASIVESMLSGQAGIEWVDVSMVSDDPVKVSGKGDVSRTLAARLFKAIGNPAREVALVSPYFVPTQAGVDALVRLRAQGVVINVLTNALESTDVVAVHAGYAKRRRDLLEAGVHLYEMRHLAEPVKKGRLFPFGRSGSSLHAKIFAVDRQRVFVGSFNFDPRSAMINTELGFVVESARLANAVTNRFYQEIPQQAYEVRLNDRQQLVWIERKGDATLTHDTEPGTGFFLRLFVHFMSVLPIEGLL